MRLVFVLDFYCCYYRVFVGGGIFIKRQKDVKRFSQIEHDAAKTFFKMCLLLVLVVNSEFLERRLAHVP